MFNGIKGDINIPGEIPWEFVLLYYVLAPTILYIVAKKEGLVKRFTTIDWVYVGIGSAFATAWEFYVGSFIDRLVPVSIGGFIDLAFWGRMIILVIVASLVRKFGVGMVSLFVFDVLADLFHYGFGGQPLYFIYESLTYGLFIDLILVVSRGKLMQGSYVISAIQGAVIGLLWALPEPIIYEMFYRPFIYGAVVNVSKAVFALETQLALIWIAGLLGGIIAHRVQRSVMAV